MCCKKMGRWKEALDIDNRVLVLRLKVLGESHPFTMASMNNKAMALWKIGQLKDAIALLEDALRLHRLYQPLDHPSALRCLSYLGMAYFQLGEKEKGTSYLSEALGKQTLKIGRSHKDTLLTMGQLAGAYAQSGQLEKADGLQREVLDLRLKVAPKDANALVAAQTDLGRTLIQEHKMKEAESLFVSALQVCKESNNSSWTYYYATSALGACLLEEHKVSEGEPLLRKGCEGMQQKIDNMQPEQVPYFAQALDRLILHYNESNKHDEMRKWQAVKDNLPKIEAAKK